MLLVSLAVLAMLTLFALTLTSVCNLERKASANYVYQVEARLAAEAGCAAAISQAKNAVDANWFSNGQWYVRGAKQPPGAFDPANPVQGFFLKTVTNQAGGSGRTYYAVESFDCGSRLSVNLNTPNIDTALGHVGVPDPTAMRTEAQSRGGFRSRRELREYVIASQGGIGTWNTIRDRVTVHEVSNQVPDVTTSGGNLPITYSGGQRGSAMVNINDASTEVLRAVLDGLSGTGITFTANGTPSPGGEWLTQGSQQGPRGNASLSVGVTLSGAAVDAAITAIQGARPIRSWQQLDDALKGAVSANHRCLIMTICGANAQAMGYNPDRDYRRANYNTVFDKGGLDQYTTEFSLGPSGVFEVRAHGWVTTQNPTNPAREMVVAEAFVSKVVRCFVPVHFGSQADLNAMSGTAMGGRARIQSMPELKGTADPVAGHLRLSSEAFVGLPAGSGSLFRDVGGTSGTFTLTGGNNNPLRSMGHYSPDGLLIWRERWGPGGINLNRGVGNFSEAGRVGFWIKLPYDATRGTDEVLFSLTFNDEPAYPTAAITAALNTYVLPATIGATVKVERFKGRIRATWYYWGSGDGAVSRFVNCLMQVYANINWRAGEWHYVSVAWENEEQDWTAAALGEPIETSTISRIRIWSTLSGGGSTSGYGFFPYQALYPGDEWFTLEGTTKKNTKYNLGKSGSVSTNLNRAYVGGHVHTGSVGGNIYDSNAPFNGTHWRFTSGTLDDAWVDGNPPTPAVPRVVPTTKYFGSGTVNLNIGAVLSVGGQFTPAAVAVHGTLPTNGAGAMPAGFGATLNGGPFPGGGTGLTHTVRLTGNGRAAGATVEGVSVYLKHRTEVLEEGDFRLSNE